MRSIAEDIQYYQGNHAVSIEAIKELVYLVQSGKMKSNLDFEGLLELLKSFNIDIIEFGSDSLSVLLSLPFYKDHPDPTDRHIIATAIAKKRTLISGDTKFSLYTKNGLQFLEI